MQMSIRSGNLLILPMDGQTRLWDLNGLSAALSLILGPLKMATIVSFYWMGIIRTLRPILFSLRSINGLFFSAFLLIQRTCYNLWMLASLVLISTTYYGRAVDNAVRGGLTGINKAIFLQLLKTARAETMQPRTIRSAFKGAGLIPFNPEHVLQKISNSTTAPSSTSSASLQPPVCRTPISSKEVQQYLHAIQVDTSLTTPI